MALRPEKTCGFLESPASLPPRAFLHSFTDEAGILLLPACWTSVAPVWFLLTIVFYLFVRLADVPFDKAGPAAGRPASPEPVFGRDWRGRNSHQNGSSQHSGSSRRSCSRDPPGRRRASVERGWIKTRASHRRQSHRHVHHHRHHRLILWRQRRGRRRRRGKGGAAAEALRAAADVSTETFFEAWAERFGTIVVPLSAWGGGDTDGDGGGGGSSGDSGGRGAARKDDRLVMSARQARTRRNMSFRRPALSGLGPEGCSPLCDEFHSSPQILFCAREEWAGVCVHVVVLSRIDGRITWSPLSQSTRPDEGSFNRINPRRPTAASRLFRGTRFRSPRLAPGQMIHLCVFPWTPFSRPGENLAVKKASLTSWPRGWYVVPNLMQSAVVYLLLWIRRRPVRSAPAYEALPADSPGASWRPCSPATFLGRLLKTPTSPVVAPTQPPITTNRSAGRVVVGKVKRELARLVEPVAGPDVVGGGGGTPPAQTVDFRGSAERPPVPSLPRVCDGSAAAFCFAFVCLGLPSLGVRAPLFLRSRRVVLVAVIVRACASPVVPLAVFLRRGVAGAGIPYHVLYARWIAASRSLSLASFANDCCTRHAGASSVASVAVQANIPQSTPFFPSFSHFALAPHPPVVLLQAPLSRGSRLIPGRTRGPPASAAASAPRFFKACTQGGKQVHGASGVEARRQQPGGSLIGGWPLLVVPLYRTPEYISGTVHCFNPSLPLARVFQHRPCILNRRRSPSLGDDCPPPSLRPRRRLNEPQLPLPPHPT